MNQALQILEFLQFSEKLKTQKRDNKLSNGSFESVADHSWHLGLMAMVTHSHLEQKVDLLKTLKMIVIHDLVEAEIGDIPYSHSIANPELKKKKDIEELQEIQKIKYLIGGELGDKIFNLWHEYKEQITLESKFVKALDSMEADYQATLLGDVSYWDDIYYKLVFTKSDKHCKHEKILQELNKEIKRKMEDEMIKIGLDVEKLRNKL